MSKKTDHTEISEQNHIQGRGAFIVEMTAAGVAVSATVVTEDGKALAMPAIFPNLGYALSQIDEMRALVIRHFEQASQIGVQVIAQQREQQLRNAKQQESPQSKSTGTSPAGKSERTTTG